MGSPNDLSVKAGVCLSVCISCSRVCLHRYLNSQASAVWTSQSRD